MKFNTFVNSRFKQIGLSLVASFFFFSIAPLSTGPFALAYSDSTVTQVGSATTPTPPVSPLIAPEYLGHGLTGKNPVYVSISGDDAYVVNYNSNNFQVFNITDPAKMTLVSTTTTGLHPQAILVHDDYAYVGISGDGNTGGNPLTERLQIFNVTNPASPVLENGEGILSNYGPIESMTVSASNYLYATEYNSQGVTSGLEAYNIANPLNVPGAAYDSYISSGPNFAVIQENKYLYIDSDGFVQIFNISVPDKPVFENPGSNNSGTFINTGLGGMRVSGDYLYIACPGNNNLYVVNVTNPAKPTITNGNGGTPLPSRAGARDLVIDGSYVDVIGDNIGGLYEYNVSNPAKPTLVGSATTGKNPPSVAISGNTAFVANYNSNTLGAFSVQ